MIALILTVVVMASVEIYFKILQRTYKNYEYHSDNFTVKRAETFMKVKGKKLLHGEVKTYFENGKIESDQEYKWGVLNGIQMYYLPSGEIDRKEVFENGTLLATMKE